MDAVPPHGPRIPVHFCLTELSLRFCAADVVVTITWCGGHRQFLIFSFANSTSGNVYTGMLKHGYCDSEHVLYAVHRQQIHTQFRCA